MGASLLFIKINGHISTFLCNNTGMNGCISTFLLFMVASLPEEQKSWAQVYHFILNGHISTSGAKLPRRI